MSKFQSSILDARMIPDIQGGLLGPLIISKHPGLFPRLRPFRRVCGSVAKPLRCVAPCLRTPTPSQCLALWEVEGLAVNCMPFRARCSDRQSSVYYITSTIYTAIVLKTAEETFLRNGTGDRRVKFCKQLGSSQVTIARG